MKRAVLAIAAVAAATAFADKVYLKSGSVLTGTGAVVADDKVKFTSDDLGAVEIPADKVLHVETAQAPKVVVAELPVEEKPPETWHGAINVAFESARGNTYKNNASARRARPRTTARRPHAVGSLKVSTTTSGARSSTPTRTDATSRMTSPESTTVSASVLALATSGSTATRPESAR